MLAHSSELLTELKVKIKSSILLKFLSVTLNFTEVLASLQTARKSALHNFCKAKLPVKLARR